MSLSRPAPRKHIHTRRIECQGFQRDDGHWDIEGTLTDSKTYSFDNVDRGGVASGEAVHRMTIRLTVNDDMVVQAAEAFTESSPYTLCTDANSSVPEIAGLTIGPGWRKEVRKIMGRTKGCTHIRDMMMGPVAQTAYQTIIPMRNRKSSEDAKKRTDRPPVLDTCHAYASDGPIVERTWPQFYTGEDLSPTS